MVAKISGFVIDENYLSSNVSIKDKIMISYFMEGELILSEYSECKMGLTNNNEKDIQKILPGYI